MRIDKNAVAAIGLFVGLPAVGGVIIDQTYNNQNGLERYDENKDGHLDTKESMRFLATEMDTNNDGKLSQEELDGARAITNYYFSALIGADRRKTKYELLNTINLISEAQKTTLELKQAFEYANDLKEKLKDDQGFHIMMRNQEELIRRFLKK